MVNNSTIMMGNTPQTWMAGRSKTITFCVTEDCNLACKYCYMTGKNNRKKMSFETAKAAVDYILEDREFFNDEAVIWEFIGGEPFLEIELIDRICDYIKLRMFMLDHPWFDRYKFSFSSNGTLYSTPKVQQYIRKHAIHLSIGLSVDGNKLKHDLQRVYPDGSGSYDDVIKNVPLWMEQFPGFSTKATFSHDDIPYLKDSVISLWESGINMVSANVVFEDVWTEDDIALFEQQLMELGDYILENKMWEDYSVRFFDPGIGYPLAKKQLQENFCGSGSMLAIDCEGNFFPCVRFYGFCLNNREFEKVGDIYSGLNKDRLRPFDVLTTPLQSPKECLECDIASGCAWCTGNNYDMADTDTVFQRMTYGCKMHKANVRANNWFWAKFEEVTGLVSKRRLHDISEEEKYLQFIASDQITSHCHFNTNSKNNAIMSREVFDKGIEFAKQNGFTPVLLGYNDYLSNEELQNSFMITKNEQGLNRPNVVNVIDCCNNSEISNTEVYMLMVNRESLDKLSETVITLLDKCWRINVVLQDLDQWEDKNIEEYSRQLDDMMPTILSLQLDEKMVQVNVLTDILYNTDMCSCDAGNSLLALAPNGKLYLCPAFYFDNEDDFVGTLDDGIDIKNSHLLTLEYAPLCSQCDAYQCKRCIYLNKKLTGEFNIPSKNQCVISHIEREKAFKYQKMLFDNGFRDINNILKEIHYKDPIEII